MVAQFIAGVLWLAVLAIGVVLSLRLLWRMGSALGRHSCDGCPRRYLRPAPPARR